MADAIIKQSANALKVDHVPSGALVAGDIVVAGELLGIAEGAIAASAKGALNVGPAVVEVVSDGSPDTGGALIYWDDSASKVSTSTDSGTNKRFGFTLPDQGATDDGDVISVIFNPVGA